MCNKINPPFVVISNEVRNLIISLLRKISHFVRNDNIRIYASLSPLLVFSLSFTYAQEKSNGSRIEGKLIPRNSITFFAPQRGYRLKGWNSGSDGVAVKFLIEEGKKVSSGELLVEFELEITNVMDWLNREYERAKTKSTVSLNDIRERNENLKVQLEKNLLYTRRLSYDLTKKGFVSEQEYKLLEIDKKIASFDSASIKKQIAINEEYYNAMDIYYTKEIASWKIYIDFMNNEYRARFKVYAPTEGYVSYPMLLNRKRKVRIGDWVRTGMPYMKLSVGKTIDVEFYLPEEYYSYATQGTSIDVVVKSSKKTYGAIITEVNKFPQYTGALEDDFETPYAMEKVFVVRARPKDEIEFMPGSEIEVKLHSKNTKEQYASHQKSN